MISEGSDWSNDHSNKLHFCVYILNSNNISQYYC